MSNYLVSKKYEEHRKGYKLEKISAVIKAYDNIYSVKYLANRYAMGAYYKDEVIEILSRFISQANNGLNDSLIEYICDTIKYVISPEWEETSLYHIELNRKETDLKYYGNIAVKYF